MDAGGPDYQREAQKCVQLRDRITTLRKHNITIVGIDDTDVPTGCEEADALTAILYKTLTIQTHATAILKKFDQEMFEWWRDLQRRQARMDLERLKHQQEEIADQIKALRKAHGLRFDNTEDDDDGA